MSHFVPEPGNFAKVVRLPASVKKYWLKETLKQIKNLINNHTFLMDEPNKGDTVTTCMDVYKANIQYDESLEKLKLIVVVRV